MSKINKLRFVNLNYNHNTMKIDDETFYLDGQDTMLNLRNGGGKSVLVQMVMAPLVNKRYRALKDRTFESYFTTNTPTYIMIEWILDDGAGYLLTGMMVRKKDVLSDEDSKDKLDIINFIHEYKEKNEYDIKRIPIVEINNGKKMVKSFLNSKKLFEELKKNKEVRFNYYDMNNTVTTKNYFEKLQEYKINHKEWETIIKQINLKESGLSELFIKAKDSSGLVKSWFLPAVENKLRKDEDRIKNYRNLVKRYIEQYKANKANIDKKEKIELFNKLSEDIKNSCDEFILTIEERKGLENKIANIIRILKNNYEDKENEEKELECLINQLVEKIAELFYEEYSIKIYRKEDKIEELEEYVKELDNLVNKSEEEKKALNRKNEILECSKIHKEYQSRSQELQSLESELKILTKKKDDNTPHINNIGFTIREILNKEISDMKEKVDERKTDINVLEFEKEKLKNILNENRLLINKLKGREGFLKASLESFDKIQSNFNDKYNENIIRNISGYFNEESLLSIRRNIEDYNFDLNKNMKNITEDIFYNKEILKSKNNEKERNIKLMFDFENQLKNNESLIEELDEKVKICIDVIKYIDFGEERVFDTEDILNAFYTKIDFLEREKSKLIRQEEDILDELDKLEGGRVLELPKEIKKKLEYKDIKIIYGMEWLKKNGYSTEKNIEVVKNNPFIPYSLIMNSSEIEILKREGLDIFISNPISIINRLDLESNFLEVDQSMVSFNKLNFFVSFNNKLLDEKELIKLIEEKKQYLESIRSNIENRKNEIRFLEKKKEIIQYSKLDKEKYENVKREKTFLEKKIIEIRENEISIAREFGKIEINISELENTKKVLEENIRKNLEKINSFNELIEEYNKYKDNKDELSLIEFKIEEINKFLKENENRELEIDKTLKDINNIMVSYNNSLEKLKSEAIEFSFYKEGLFIKKDKEDLLAEFYVLNKQITASEKDLKKRREEKSRAFKEIEDELNAKANKYNVAEAEYINEVYNINRDFELKDLIEKEDKNYNYLKDKRSNILQEIASEKSNVENLYESLEKDLGKTKAKSKALLYDKNFKEEIAKLKIEKASNEKKIKEVINEKNKIDKYLIDLSQFNEFVIEKEEDIFIDIKDLDNTIGSIKRDLFEKKDLELKREAKLNNCIVDIENKDSFRNENIFKSSIQSLKSLVSKPIKFKEHLNLVINSYNSIIEKLLIDIKLIEDEEEKILDSILEYIEEVNKNISIIDDNSTININNKRVKMLNITVQDFEKNKINYRLKLKDYIEAIRERAIKELEKNNSIEEIISNNITLFKLYDEIIGVENVEIKLYKIEENRQRIISWDEVSKNSGGEGFLSAFVILTSLLSYMRKDENDIFSRKEDGKVLIMDNPFAQTSSSHLLKPLMDIAKKSNTQLICLTGLGGDSIYNRFDNIYVLNLVSSKLNNSIKYMKSEHIKGDKEEKTEIIVSSRLKIEEQTSLF
ncbi:hypothetical protein [Clostridium perfringens]|uniref:Chromosome segregation ATPase n=1 Tax=Clostridium perfringens (strain SM101 / Type A) TaxID=289380 RepID=Q0SW14_CLOPS|nr:hypothetical protein [Clostridium perfringens]ABG87324.1 hypothetical protein CPR_0357 [Clostridium perfringens SM101]MDK0890444.1 hypothetical protein [Clostridium perfringens]UBK56014.1 hypothetical protein KLF47_01775 [Clostridium perfringens]SQB58387.1 chromosome segregation ATPase [Clostridium perfringens]SUY38295.1 chromosome segregation ATPase [Clostridium perfringens]